MVNSARAWPSVIRPSARRALIGSGSFEQAHGVGDRHAALAHALRDLILRQAEFFDQLFVGQRLFQRIEVGALHILDQRHFQHLLRRDVLDDDRHGFQPGQLRGAPAAFAGDERELIFAGCARR